MATNFPTSADDATSLPDPTAASYTNSPSHVNLHANANAAIKAIEAKVGNGASTPPGSNYIFTSTSSGVSSWQPAPAAGVWGLITGTLASQTDLQNVLNLKLNLSGGTMGGLLVLSADPAANLGAATKQYVDALGSTSLVRNETPGGSINGSNTAYTTAATFATGSLKVYLNGQRLAPGAGIDYVEGTQAFTMQYAPATGDVLLVDYETTNTTRFVQGSNSIIVQETPTGTVNGSNTSFTTLQVKYVANTLEVFINGIAQTRTTDYTETTPSSGVFTFAVAPLTGDIVRVNYQFATGASGNADTVDGIHASATATANQLLALDSVGTFPQSAVQSSTLGYTAITGNFTTVSTTAVQVTGLTVTVTIPAGGRRVKISAFVRDTFASASSVWQVSIWDGTVASGTQLAAMLANNAGTSGITVPAVVSAIVTPSAGSKTYNIGALTSGGTLTLEAAATYPAYILVELI